MRIKAHKKEENHNGFPHCNQQQFKAKFIAFEVIKYMETMKYLCPTQAHIISCIICLNIYFGC